MNGTMALLVLFVFAIWFSVAELSQGFPDSQEHPLEFHELPDVTRMKRIVVGNHTRLPPRPLQIGNLTNEQGEAVCYFVDANFYCISNFLAPWAEAQRYCRWNKMKLVSIESEEEHEYLYAFFSNQRDSVNLLKKDHFTSEEEYSEYVFNNIGPGLLVKCISVCGNVKATAEGRVLEFERRDYIGVAIKVQWSTGMVRWYPAGNLEIIGYKSRTKPVKQHADLTLEETILEPGDRVRINPTLPLTETAIWNKVQPGEIGIISDLEVSGDQAIVYFPSNKGWRGLLSHLEITDKRKTTGTIWTSGKFNRQKGWLWTSVNKALDFQNWSKGEPHFGRGDNCLVIKFHKDAKWFNEKCNLLNYFVCKS